MNSKAIRRGLSLLEVILSIAILGGALAVIGQLMRIGARSAIEARDQATAQLYCETKMNEVAAGVELPESVSDSPLDETGEWVYSVDVTPTDLDGILAVNVTVSQNPQSFSRPISRSFSRWIVDPEFAQTAADEETTIAQAFTDAQAIAKGPVSGTTKGQTVAMDGSAGGVMAGGGGQAGGGRRRGGGQTDGGGRGSRRDGAGDGGMGGPGGGQGGQGGRGGRGGPGEGQGGPRGAQGGPGGEGGGRGGFQGGPRGGGGQGGQGGQGGFRGGQGGPGGGQGGPGGGGQGGGGQGGQRGFGGGQGGQGPQGGQGGFGGGQGGAGGGRGGGT